MIRPGFSATQRRYVRNSSKSTMSSNVGALGSRFSVRQKNVSENERYEQRSDSVSPLSELNSAPYYNGVTNGHGAAGDDLSVKSSERVVEGYLGFANIPNQVLRKSIQRGFEFSLMVVGPSGLGKSTFINSLLMSEVQTANSGAKVKDDEAEPQPKTVHIEEHGLELEEKGVRLKLNLVDTPGFGDALDNTDCWRPIIDYIDAKNENYLNEEMLIQRARQLSDKRVHVCLYFIAPHQLRALDVAAMRQLHERVNLVPVIAKADTLTAEERREFKQLVLDTLQRNNIRIFYATSPEGERQAAQAYSVIGGTSVTHAGGRRSRCRKYPWGQVDIDNPEYSDFIPLRNLLLRTHTIDLISVTSCVHYENYRCRAFCADGGDGADVNLLGSYERDAEKEFERKREQMDATLKEKLAERLHRISVFQEDVEKTNRAHKEDIQNHRIELQERRRAFEAEQAEFIRTHADYLKFASSVSLNGEEEGGRKKLLKRPSKASQLFGHGHH